MEKYTFSKKGFTQKVYKTAIDDYKDLTDFFEIDDYDFDKINDNLILRDCGKNEYDFDFNTLTVTIEKDEQTNKVKIKTVRIFDKNSCEFLCYMYINKGV